MYNDQRYSFTRYSVNRETEKTIETAVQFRETMGSLAGGSVSVDVREQYSEAAQGTALGTISVVTALDGAAGLLAHVRMSANVVAAAVLADALESTSYAQKNTPAALDSADSLFCARILSGKNTPAGLTAAKALESLTRGSKNTPAACTASEVLTAASEATSQRMEQAMFAVVIPPGGELRIDSDQFLVLLNGENALHTQSGDWITISRSLLRINIESASGGPLEGQLIYTERYL